ncbi:hypothetical protein, conserved [Plasmodium gonderi]|uniref:Uncharacterized protein n=1 Tax=Plasmodium gonderi TaxID=77519 RepID=A0A1Y1JIJ7_PLAGO|nr:hypothetical protein, conserved [Plasmodium gonderi]GAW79904.1 hypothetical protein, conserved [Plasmodium gonderi]
MISRENTQNGCSWDTKKDADVIGGSCHKSSTVKKKFNYRMDSFIEFTENLKNRVCLMESQNKTKKTEAENEYLFLKEIGDVCKMSCDYYLETNVNFHEACENFKILFSAFQDSLVNIKKKREEADAIEEELNEIEQEEFHQMKQREEINESLKKEFMELETDVDFMNNESVNITNKIKEVDYQINQHKEAFESFHILAHLNSERISALQNDYKKACSEKEEILRSIEESSTSMGLEKDNLVLQKNQMEEQKEKLLAKEKELAQKKEKLTIQKSEMNSNNERIKAQVQFLQNQISSQEYFLSVIKCGLEGTVRTRKELDDTSGHIKQEINKVQEMMENVRREEVEEKGKFQELDVKVKQLNMEFQKGEVQLEESKDAERELLQKIQEEKRKSSQNMLKDLIKEKKLVDDDIDRYQEEARNLVLREERKLIGGEFLSVSLLDANVGNVEMVEDEMKKDGMVFPDKVSMPNEETIDTMNPLDAKSRMSKSLVKELEGILEKMKIRIKEEQNELWKKEREEEKINIRISEMEGKIKEEESREKKLDIWVDEKREELKSIKEREKDGESKLSYVQETIKEMKLNYEEKEKKKKEIESEMQQFKEMEDNKMLQLQKEYQDRTKNLYESKNGNMGISSVEKKKMKDDMDSYSEKIKQEYDLKKSHFEKAEREKYEQMNIQLDGEFKRKEDLIAYYEELIYKQENMRKVQNETNSHDRIISVENFKKIDNNQLNRSNSTTENRKSSQKNSINNNTNNYKLHNMSDKYKFGYFDVTSPEAIRKSMNIPSRSVKSPHIARLLEKIKNRKDSQNFAGPKNTPVNQVSTRESRRSRSIGGMSKRGNVGKGGKSGGNGAEGSSRNSSVNGAGSKPSHNARAQKSNTSFDLFHHL